MYRSVLVGLACVGIAAAGWPQTTAIQAGNSDPDAGNGMVVQWRDPVNVAAAARSVPRFGLDSGQPESIGGVQSAGGSPDLQRSEFSIQVSGVLTHNANNGPTTHLANNSAGVLIGYRVHLTPWEALEVEYGYTRNGQKYFIPATAGGAPAANYAVQANMHSLLFNEVATTPRLFGFLQPFILGGGGVVFFRPTGGSTVIASNQTRGAFNYGGGFDFHIDHIGARVEYQGMIFKVPDFGNPLLSVNKWTHVAQPSVGLVFTF